MRVSLFRYFTAALLAALAGAIVCPMAHADEITFRPDPFGNPGQTFQITGFESFSGNVLVKNQVNVIQNGGGEVEVIFQSRLNSLTPGSVVPPGLGTNYEILMLAHFWMTATPLSTTDVLLTMATTPGLDNVVQLRYHDIGVNGPINDQTGAGYNSPGDPIILEGRVVDIPNSIGLLFDQLPPELLDQSPTSPGDGTMTLVFGGSQNLDIAVDFTNPLFFPNPNQTLTQLIVSTQATTPFLTVSPNTQGAFWTGDTPQLGTTNGVNGPDILYTTDPSINIRVQETVVPEPTTVALLLVGLGGLGAARVRRRLRRSV